MPGVETFADEFHGWLGGIGLVDPADGLLLSGDEIYSDESLDDIPGVSLTDYAATMECLRHLDCRLIVGGHGPVMDRARMVQIAVDGLRAKG